MKIDLQVLSNIQKRQKGHLNLIPVFFQVQKMKHRLTDRQT